MEAVEIGFSKLVSKTYSSLVTIFTVPMASMVTEEENVPETVLGSVTVRGIRASDSAEAGIASSLAAADAGEGKGDDGSGDEREVGAGVDVVNVATGEVVPLNKHAHHDHEGCGTFRPPFRAPPRAVCVCVCASVCVLCVCAVRVRCVFTTCACGY